MTITLEKPFKLITGEEVVFSIYRGELLFLHSAFISSQFVLNEFGVNVYATKSHSKLELIFTKSEQHIGLYFELCEFKPLQKYFRSLGFPVPEISRFDPALKLVVGAPSITCPKCQKTSWNKDDIENKYCGKCGYYKDF